MERKLVLKVATGSKLYGLQIPSSDVDFSSVIMPFPKDVLGLQKLEEIDNSTKKSSEKRRNTEEDVDDKMFTLPRYLHLLMNGNPEKTEMLFAEEKNILYKDPIMDFVFENKQKLLSKRILKSFSGFAYSQKKKLVVKKERFTSLIEASKYMEDYYKSRLLTNDNSLTEIEANNLNSILKYYKGQKNNCESFHKGMSPKMIYDKIISERDNYGWRVRTSSFETLGFDIKFGYHILRLLSECRQLLEYGEIHYPFSGKEYDEIMTVRRGEVLYEDFLLMIKEYENRIRPFEENNTLIDHPDFNFFNDWIIQIQLDYFKGLDNEK